MRAVACVKEMLRRHRGAAVDDEASAARRQPRLVLIECVVDRQVLHEALEAFVPAAMLRRVREVDALGSA